MNTLNDSSVLAIVKFLSPLDRINFAEANPRWQNVVVQSFQYKTMDFSYRLKRPKDLIKISVQQIIKLIELSGHIFQNLIMRCPFDINQCVKIDSYFYEINGPYGCEAIFRALSFYCINLKTIKMENFGPWWANFVDVNSMLKLNEQLENLHIESNTSMINITCIDVLINFNLIPRNLKILKLENTFFGNIKSILGLLSSVTNLHLVNIGNFTDKCLVAICEKGILLTELHLKHVEIRSPHSLKQIADLKNLETLALNFIRLTDPENALLIISMHCQKLKWLSLGGLSIFSPELEVMLFFLKNLEVLELNKIKDLKRMSIWTPVSKLHTLNVYDCEFKFIDSLYFAIDKLPFLTHLNIIHNDVGKIPYLLLQKLLVVAKLRRQHFIFSELTPRKYVAIQNLEASYFTKYLSVAISQRLYTGQTEVFMQIACRVLVGGSFKRTMGILTKDKAKKIKLSKALMASLCM